MSQSGEKKEKKKERKEGGKELGDEGEKNKSNNIGQPPAYYENVLKGRERTKELQASLDHVGAKLIPLGVLKGAGERASRSQPGSSSPSFSSPVWFLASPSPPPSKKK